ncbi:4-hydroxy-tetrahydrodipicolinate synthase [Nitriliruptor alkaliphilus]|uniref:4-hydroxy-tetrahydrodipicolinate synthase n=1 Tax=Nitriliruptor alkaliphilus TaxID=427918 RepID=UPI000B0E468D|nr:4-hydroxy-tetrahydrodipicolinate synthase [Nitriliruptor alkaliphilus]
MSAHVPAPPTGIGRVVTAMITPFTSDGALDLDGAQTLADHLVSNGTDTVLVHGTTGESPTLLGEEMWELLAAVKDAVGDRANVMMGSGSNATATAIRSTQRATEMGADSLLVVTPYYNKPDQRGLVRHFRAVAEVTDLPIVLYDIKPRTATAIEVSTMVDLAEVPNIVGTKDASGEWAKVGDVLVATEGAPGGFGVWSGADEFNLGSIATGATGVISVAAHLVGRELAEMIDVFATDPLRARQLHLACLPLHRALFAEPSPAPLKAAMNELGLPAGPVRLPLAEASPEATRTVLDALERVRTTLASTSGAPTR